MEDEVQTIPVSFEMTDALVSQAVREDCVASGRTHIKWKSLLIVICCIGIFVSAILQHSLWAWWISALPPAVFIVLLAGWLIACWHLPRVAKNRLASLPHRNVTIELDDARLVFVTATERLEVGWGELKALTRLKSFWLICLKAGQKIPVPAGILPKEAVRLMQSRLNLMNSAT
jgi:hypothetical protein